MLLYLKSVLRSCKHVFIGDSTSNRQFANLERFLQLSKKKKKGNELFPPYVHSFARVFPQQRPVHGPRASIPSGLGYGNQACYRPRQTAPTGLSLSRSLSQANQPTQTKYGPVGYLGAGLRAHYDPWAVARPARAQQPKHSL